MLKSILLTLTFAVVFGAVGLSLSENAGAQSPWGSPYTSYYYGPPAYDYGYYAPYRYRSYYAPQSSYWAPQAYYYAPRPSYYTSYYYRSPDYYQPVPQVAWRAGWVR